MYILAHFDLFKGNYTLISNKYNNSKLFSDNHLIHFFKKYKYEFLSRYERLNRGSLIENLEEECVMWLDATGENMNTHFMYFIINIDSKHINNRIEDLKDEGIKSKLKLIIRDVTIDNLLV